MSAPGPGTSDEGEPRPAPEVLSGTIIATPEVEETISVDLTSEGESVTALPGRGHPSKPISEKSYDPQESHDFARRAIAYWLLGLLSFLIFAAFISYGVLYFGQPTASSPNTDDLLALVQLILTPLLTLVSAATGFYFGAHHSQKSPVKD